MNKPLYSRNFNVDYFEKNENLWKVTSYLKDNTHEILVELDVSVPDMIIKNANANFIKYPMEGCILIKEKIKDVIGLCLFGDFSEKIRQMFMGCAGCPNVMHLLGTSAPGIIYFYYSEQMKRGNIKNEEWWGMVTTKLSNACIAHKALADKYGKYK